MEGVQDNYESDEEESEEELNLPPEEPVSTWHNVSFEGLGRDVLSVIARSSLFLCASSRCYVSPC